MLWRCDFRKQKSLNTVHTLTWGWLCVFSSVPCFDVVQECVFGLHREWKQCHLGNWATKNRQFTTAYEQKTTSAMNQSIMALCKDSSLSCQGHTVFFISTVIRQPESFHFRRKTGDGLFIWVLIIISKHIHGSQCGESLWIINHCYPPGPPILLPHCSPYQSMKQKALFSQGTWISDFWIIFLNNIQTFRVIVGYCWTKLIYVKMQWMQCIKHFFSVFV